MTDINDNFEQAAIAAKSLPVKPDDETLLRLYALYKQGSSGDVSGEKPGFFDFVASAKYAAWEGFKGLDQNAAKQQYIDLVKALSA